jgi:hypothetical protein
MTKPANLQLLCLRGAMLLPTTHSSRKLVTYDSTTPAIATLSDLGYPRAGADGSRNEGAVKGAVQDFATSHGLAVTVAYQEDGNPWKSWMMRKPVQC